MSVKNSVGNYSWWERIYADNSDQNVGGFPHHYRIHLDNGEFFDIQLLGIKVQHGQRAVDALGKNEK